MKSPEQPIQSLEILITQLTLKRAENADIKCPQ